MNQHRRRWYEYEMQDGTPLLAAIALWLLVIAAFCLGLYAAGWIFKMSWANTVYFTGLILSALSVLTTLLQRGIKKWKK